MKTALPLACALAALILLTLATGARGLWNPDEPREAAVAREMWLRGDAVVPYLNGAPFLEKPPLYSWVSGLAFTLRGGPDPVGARVGSNLAGAALVGLTVRLAQSTLPDAPAVLAGAALAGMPLFWWHASRANLDIPLAFFVSLAVAAFYRAWRRSRSVPTAGGYHHRALDVCAAATALAALTKGLVGIALPVLIVAAFLALERDLAFLLRLRWPRLIAILALPVLGWLIPFARRDDGALAYAMFVTHHVERYVAGFDHQNPWWHYLFTIPTSTLPWLPLALPAALDRQTTGPEASLRRLALAWLLAPVLFFSASASKRDLYMLPSFPAIALLVALSAPRAGRLPRSMAGLAAVLSLAIAAALGPLAPRGVRGALAHAQAATPALIPLLAGAWALAAVALGARAMLRGGRHAAWAAAAPALLTAALALNNVFPSIDALKSAAAITPLLASIPDLVGYQLREPDFGQLTFPRREPIWIASWPGDLAPLFAEGRRIVGSASVLLPALERNGLKWRELGSAVTGSDRFVIVERAAAATPAEGPSHARRAGRKVALTLRSMVH